MKKILFFTVILVLLLAVGIYFYYSSYPGNGFTRKWQNKALKVLASKNFPYDVYFAIKPNDKIIVKKREFPLQLLQMDTHLNGRSNLTPALPKGFNAGRHNYYFNQLSNGLSVANEQGELTSLVAGQWKLFKFPNLKFDDPTLLSAHSAVVRVFKVEQKIRYLELAKLNLTSDASLSGSFKIPASKEGIFSSDGMLQYDQDSNKIYYVFYHTGQFLCLDTNLQVLYQAKTIDTIQHTRLNLTTYRSPDTHGKIVQKTTLIGPGNLVNKYYSIANKKLYLLSGLRSDNQKLEDFINHATIDVYEVKNGTYLYSFIIPDFEGLLLRQFHLDQNRIVAIYDKHVVVYGL